MTAALGYAYAKASKRTEAKRILDELQKLSATRYVSSYELAAIYVERGLEPKLAAEVSKQLMAKDALGAHARDELGISEVLLARPIQAALASAASFAVGASLPLVTVIVSPAAQVGMIVAALSLAFLALLGAVAARVGRANVLKGTLRVTFWGAIAMALTAAIGSAFGIAG